MQINSVCGDQQCINVKCVLYLPCIVAHPWQTQKRPAVPVLTGIKQEVWMTRWPPDSGWFKSFLPLPFFSLINHHRRHTDSAPHYEAVKRFPCNPLTLKHVNLAVKLTGSEMLKRLRNAPGGTFYLIRTSATIMKTNYTTHCVRGLKMML